MATQVTPLSARVTVTKTATILSGATQSGEVDLGGQVLVGISIPTTWNGTALTFQVSPITAGTFSNLITQGSATTYSITVVDGQANYVALNPDVFRGVRFLKISSGSSQTTTDTILTLHTRSLF